MAKKTTSKKTKSPKVAKKETPSKQETQERNVLAGVLFLLIGIGMIAFSAFLLWTRVLVAPDLEKILPENNLVGFVNLETLSGASALQTEHPEWHQKFLLWQESFLGWSMNTLQEFRGDRGGLALYRTPQGVEADDVNMLSFIAVENTAAAKEFLLQQDSVEVSTIENIDLYSLPTRHCVLYSEYLLCSVSQQLLDTVIKSNASGAPTISESKDFQKIAAQVPRQHLARIFLRSEAFVATLPQTALRNSLLPFAKNISHVALTIRERGSRNLELSSVFWRNELGPEKDISNEKVVFSGRSPEMLDFLPPNATAFLWGNDIAEDFVNGFRYFQQIDPALELMARGQLRKWTNDFFGGEIDWELDILPLLEKEFIVGTDTEGWFAVFQTGDEEFAKAKMERVQAGLVKMSARFIPRIISHTLEDGTVIREVFPNEEAVEVEETAEDNMAVFEMTASDGADVALEASIGESEGVLVVGTGPAKARSILKNTETAPLAQNLSVEFAGASEEVFAFTPAFLSQWMETEQMLAFKKGVGKFVTTPLFLRTDLQINL